MIVSSLKRLSGYAGLARDAYRLNRSDQEAVRQQARRHLIQRMGKLRGLPQKLGQMLSFSHDDQQAAAEFASLQEQAQPLPLQAVRPVIEAAWGRPLEQVLGEINPHAHAASLGQVHQGLTHDGQQVAVKVQYPGIRESVTTDLKMLGWLSTPVGSLRRGFDLSAYRQVILEDLQRELDYCLEADSQREFSRSAQHSPFLIVPRVVDQLSTDKVLVTEWQDGQRFDEVCDCWKKEDRRALGKGLLNWFLHALFTDGRIHADLHPGNLRFRRGHDGVKLVLYDFGCVYRPSARQRLALLRLIRATLRRDEPPWPLMMALGFDPEYLQPLADKLPALCKVLFEPFGAHYPYHVKDWHLGQRVGDILGDDRWNFRIAGPPDLIFLLRAFHGLKYYLEGLDVPVFWQQIVEPLLEQHREEMDRLDLPERGRPGCDFSTLATYLKIRVRQDGCTKVELTGYASGIDDLDELIGPELRGKIAAQNIDLNEIISGVRRRGYTPGPVFQWTEGPKQVDVWLE